MLLNIQSTQQKTTTVVNNGRHKIIKYFSPQQPKGNNAEIRYISLEACTKAVAPQLRRPSYQLQIA